MESQDRRELGRVLARTWTEAKLTQVLLAKARVTLRGSVVLKINDHSTSGIPDAAITWNGRTCWIEVKYANPGFKSTGIQELTCCRLALAGRCVYVVYDGPHNTVSIIAPQDIGRWREVGQRTDGLDHAWIVERIRELLA